MAAIGLEQLKKFDKFVVKRQDLAKKYDQLLSNCSMISSLSRDYYTIVPHIYVVRVKGMNNRKEIQQRMLDKNIQVGYHYQPNHWLNYYANDSILPLPITEKVFPELLSLPLHPDMEEAHCELVVNELINIILDLNMSNVSDNMGPLVSVIVTTFNRKKI